MRPVVSRPKAGVVYHQGKFHKVSDDKMLLSFCMDVPTNFFRVRLGTIQISPNPEGWVGGVGQMITL